MPNQEIYIKQFDKEMFKGNIVKIAGVPRRILSADWSNEHDAYCVVLEDYEDRYIVKNPPVLNRKQRRIKR